MKKGQAKFSLRLFINIINNFSINLPLKINTQITSYYPLQKETVDTLHMEEEQYEYKFMQESANAPLELHT